jgi:zinc D-Ala-D-Ala dipeptidase
MTQDRISRREICFALPILPLAVTLTGCQPSRPDKDVPFLPAKADRDAAKQPPINPGQLVELIKLDPTIRLDMRYATTNNFTGRVLYTQARAFLTQAAATSFLRAHARARADGFGFTIFDAYRPWRVTKQLWDATPKGPKKNYVANPKRGSRHNRGCAVDMTLFDLKTGQLVEMPSGFDDFSEKAHRDYADDTPAAAANALRLERYMTAEGFFGMSNEWWHFDFTGWEKFPVQDTPFEQL